MPIFLAGLLEGAMALLSRLLFTRLGQWLIVAASFVGIELATMSGTLNFARDKIYGAMGGIPAEIAQWMGVLNLDVYVTIIVGAHMVGGLKKILMRRKSA